MGAWVLRLLASAAVGIVADRVSGVANGSCPDALGSLCGHWTGIAGGLGFLAVLLGAKRMPVLATKRSALTDACPTPLASEPDPLIHYAARTNAEIAADEKSGSNGAG